VAVLLDDVRAAILGDLVDARPPVRTAEEYAALVSAGKDALAQRSEQVLLEVIRVLADWRETDRLLSGRAELATLPALQDMREQLARLVGPGFLADAGADRLRRFPTYLLAMRRRREQLGPSTGSRPRDNVARDRQLMGSVRPLEEAYLHRVAALPEGRPPGDTLRRARWMLEEYRVSLFAQQLGTDGPVSDARIRKLLAG
jgi:ATP-dependent helicase HrpA